MRRPAGASVAIHPPARLARPVADARRPAARWYHRPTRFAATLLLAVLATIAAATAALLVCLLLYLLAPVLAVAGFVVVARRCGAGAPDPGPPPPPSPRGGQRQPRARCAGTHVVFARRRPPYARRSADPFASLRPRAGLGATAPVRG